MLEWIKGTVEIMDVHLYDWGRCDLRLDVLPMIQYIYNTYEIITNVIHPYCDAVWINSIRFNTMQFNMIWCDSVACKIILLLTTSSSYMSTMMDICNPEYFPPTACNWINFCYLQKIFRAFQWYHMWRGGVLVPFSSSFRKMMSISASTFCEQIVAWNVVGIFSISLLRTH